MISINLFISLIGLISNGILIGLCSFSSAQANYTMFATVSLIEVIIFIMCNKKQSDTLVNFSFFFVLCLYLFSFGQVVLMGFFPIACENLTIVLRYFDIIDLFSGLKWLNTTFILVEMGILIANEIERNNYSPKLSCNMTEDILANKAITIIVLTFPVKIIVDLIVLSAGLRVGFEQARNVLSSIPSFIVAYGNLATIGFSLLILSLKNKRRKQFWLFCFILIYTLGMMLCGRRSESVACLCIYVLCYVSGKEIKIKTVLISGILGYLILTFLNAVVTIRNTSMGITDAFWYTLTKKNILYEALREYGNTAYTALTVIIKWLPLNPPSFGKSYFLGVSAIFPNFGGIMGDLTRASNYGFTLQKSTVLSKYYHNIGGSVLGELFFNFGFLGACVFALILGIVVGKISMRANLLINQTMNYKVCYYIAVMAGILYWIRDYFSGICRDIVWGLLICFIVKKLSIGTNISIQVEQNDV